jgi:hypothetical protein
MKRKMFAIVSALIVCGVPALAQQGPGPGPGNPPPPGAIAHHCRVRINRIAMRTANRMHVVANHAIFRINQQQAEGNDEQAATIAENATNHVNTMAEARSGMIANLVENCVNTLTELEADQAIIDMLLELAENRTNFIENRRAAEVQRVADALADTGGGDGE